MKVLITGAAGFVGTHLTQYLLKRGHTVTAVVRKQKDVSDTPENLTHVLADTTIPGPWQESLQDVDAVINLAGVTIFQRWNKKVKKRMYDSRVLTTRNVVTALPESKNVTLLSASAVGFYGDGGENPLTENASRGNDFLAGLAGDWEEEALTAQIKGVRTVLTRFGVIIGRNGGAMKMMKPVFSLGLGGVLGNGRQWFPWIHMADLTSAMQFLLGNHDIEGPVNFCSPIPVRNAEMTRALGKTLHRPTFFRLPAFAIRLFMGELGGTLLSSQHAVPEKLVESGFRFQYPDIRDAFQNIIHEKENESRYE